jgi:hypothetical protein
MRRVGSLVAILVFGVAGCSPKLNMEKSFEASTAGDTFTLSPIRREQKVKVTATATGGKIDVYVYLDKNKAAAEKDILSKKLGSNLLASQENADTVNLNATVPGGEEAVVRVNAASLKKTNVALKITNQ